MKNLLNMTLILLLVSLLPSLTACGGGDDAPPPVPNQEQSLAGLTLAGGNDTLGSLQFDLILPEGFTLETDVDDRLIAGVFTSTFSGEFSVNYQPEDALNYGQLTLALINAEGFSAGADVTLVHDMTVDEILPLNSEFTIANLLVTDLNGVELTGYSIEIDVQQQTVTLQ